MSLRSQIGTRSPAPQGTSRERIIESLEESEGGLCDGCLSRAASVSPSNQVNQICNRLAESGKIDRRTARCPSCKKVRLVNLIFAATPSGPRDGTRPPFTAKDNGGATSEDPVAYMVRIQKRIVARLDSTQPRRSGEGVSARVIRMREEGLVPGPVACILLLLNSFRNLAVHEDFLPRPSEWAVIQAAWAAAQAWIGSGK